MHPNPTFRQTAAQEALSLARTRGFGLLALSAQGAPLLSHVPFLLSDDGTQARLHLVRSNPICRACAQPLAATLAVSGPDGYISPDWYGLDDQVPTWNYLAVHLTGTLHPLPIEDLEPMLADQSAAFEARLQPKPPWTMDKMTADTRTRFLRMILPFRLQIDDVQSTFKLNQNKPDAARHAAADSVQTGLGSDLAALARWMRTPPRQD
ncbi:FMN-binding negative transcriptional regulator [Maliponia aquimaris]|uniref:Protease synthase and sporulation protein PAI 2 n=1 Tax=Maliponia aquimaris TaxID=1673631 RepID=A0A238KWD2_9RHOB|nr:FMN-binding negative transcriptional regulator [Maliponia aquimaris]SMX46512.1 Protease synthase and sporulation protein PAI 2 [Maliponia aquimaris]